ncbi:MAG: hypothetical protein IH991_25940, partial [Planctomycetes bacterium]|nr:hypothetical protein [Planctomycetota bacterium]
MTIDQVAERFDNVRPTNGGYSARCSAHEDRNNSLSINSSDDGKVLVHCHAGCPTEEVVKAAGLRMSDLMPNTDGNGRLRTILATYDYRDANGDLKFQKVRYDDPNNKFAQRRPDGNGGWHWNLRGVKKILFRSDRLEVAKPDQIVFVMEGEKDVETAERVGLLATTSPDGAAKPRTRPKWRKSYSEQLRGRRAVFVGDNDEPGRAHRDYAAQTTLGVANSVKVIELPGLSDKGADFTNWIDAGHTVDELFQLVEAAVEFESTEQDSRNEETNDGLIKMLADRICAIEYFAQDAGSKAYRFSGGVYRAKAEQFIKQRVKALCVDLRFAKEWTPRLAENVVEFIRVDSPELWERPPLDVLNVKNGLLRLKDRKLLPHSHEQLVTVQLPVKYDPNATCPRWQRFLSEVFAGNDELVAF